MTLIKIFFQENVVTCRKNFPKFFPAGPFIRMLQIKCLLKCHYFQNLPCPEKFLVMRLSYILHHFSWGHNQSPKAVWNMQKIICSSPFTPCKNRQQVWMFHEKYEHNNFAAVILINILLILIKKAQRHWMNSNIHRVSIGKKKNKFWRKLFDQHLVEFEN